MSKKTLKYNPYEIIKIDPWYARILLHQERAYTLVMHTSASVREDE